MMSVFLGWPLYPKSIIVYMYIKALCWLNGYNDYNDNSDYNCCIYYKDYNAYSDYNEYNNYNDYRDRDIESDSVKK